jgi:hypothetical protein
MSRTLHALAAVVSVLVLALARPAAADAFRIAGTAGVGSAFGRIYEEVGGRLGYGLGFGLEATVDGSWWFGQSPSFFKLAPGLTWYLPIPLLRPYVGAYYAHWFVSNGIGDEDSVGARAGVTLISVGPASVSVGAMYDWRLACATDCNGWGPEIAAAFGF